MPLTDEERDHIHEEETVRVTAREQAALKLNPYLKFFNSALGIWSLSFILGGIVTWQYGLFTEQQDKAAITASALSKAKFDLRVVCDNTLATIGTPKTLTYNRISSAASSFRYTPEIPGEMGKRFGVIEILNQIASQSPNDAEVLAYRKRSYELFRDSNSKLGSFSGWFSTIGEADPVIWNDLKKSQQDTIHSMIALLKEMSEFSAK